MPPTFDTSPPAETPCRGATSGVAGPTLRAAPSHGRYAERSEPRMRERADRDSNTRTITDGTDGTPEAGRPSDRCSGPLTWAFLWHPQRDSNPCRHLERAQTDPHGGPWSPLRPGHGTARPHTDPLNAPSFVELVARWMARRVGCWTAGERTPKGRRGAPGRVTDRILFESSPDLEACSGALEQRVVVRRTVAGWVREWLGPKSRSAGWKPATLDDRDVPGCPPGPAYLARAASVMSCR